MKNKGFTLIELLAVIVILAIIALIAVPIILNIVNDARKEANERSVELYAKAVENAVVQYQMKENEMPTTYEEIKDYIKYDGEEITVDKLEINEDGSFYMAGIKKGEKTVADFHGTKKQQYYSWLEGKIGEKLPSDAKKSVSELDTKNYPFYIGLEVDGDNNVTAAYICFKRNGIEHCLKGNDAYSYSRKQALLNDAFRDATNACSNEEDVSYCYDSNITVYANKLGSVSVEDMVYNEAYCSVSDNEYYCDITG